MTETKKAKFKIKIHPNKLNPMRFLKLISVLLLGIIACCCCKPYEKAPNAVFIKLVFDSISSPQDSVKITGLGATNPTRDWGLLPYSKHSSYYDEEGNYIQKNDTLYYYCYLELEPNPNKNFSEFKIEYNNHKDTVAFSYDKEIRKSEFGSCSHDRYYLHYKNILFTKLTLDTTNLSAYNSDKSSYVTEKNNYTQYPLIAKFK